MLVGDRSNVCYSTEIGHHLSTQVQLDDDDPRDETFARGQRHMRQVGRIKRRVGRGVKCSNLSRWKRDSHASELRVLMSTVASRRTSSSWLTSGPLRAQKRVGTSCTDEHYYLPLPSATLKLPANFQQLVQWEKTR